jgi:hypothetical protein
MNIGLLTISTDNIWKLCGKELKEFIFIGKDRTNIPERNTTITPRNLSLNIDRQASCNILI